MVRNALWALLLFFASATGNGATPTVVQDPTQPQLSVRLHLDKSVYRVGDSMRLGLFIKNISHEEMYVVDNIGLDESDTLGLSIKSMPAGKRYEVWLRSDPLPPLPSKEGYKRLFPNELCGVEVSLKLAGFFINQPGEYEITALYESPISSNSRYSYNLPMWGKEKGIVRSDPVLITIEK